MPCLAIVMMLVAAFTCPPAPARDIRTFSQQFNQSDNRIDPWIITPANNVASSSTLEHPGLLTIWEEGKGVDIKGILKDPIKFADYPPPWEFHLGIMQNYLATKGLGENQINYAIGVNVALIFSDPSTWPKDRSKVPPDTHSVQLFVVHLGNMGEVYRQGVPQVRRTELNSYDDSPEVYLAYGRGDLAPNAIGNWKIGNAWVGIDPCVSGTQEKSGGPAESVIRFRVAMTSPTSLMIGIGFGVHPGWKLRVLDISRFGKPTGVWEIGPIISADRWIPDTLAGELGLNKPPAWQESMRQRNQYLGMNEEKGETISQALKTLTTVDPPDPKFQYYVDYATFYGNGLQTIEQLSDDFNVPGFLADQKYLIEGEGISETYSNPGYMTTTLYGMNGGWAICPIYAEGDIDLTRRKPPFEIEMGFIPPENSRIWNLWWNIGLYDEEGKFHGWQPGIKNMPGQGCRYFNLWTMEPDKIQKNDVINPELGPEIAKILNHKPIRMLLQVTDEYHLRVGFKSKKTDPWVFSSPFDSSKAFGKITKFAYPALVSFQGPHIGRKGWGVGNAPEYQKILIDYIHYRFGKSD